MSWLRRVRFWLIGQAGVNLLTRWLASPLYRWTGGASILGRSLGNLTILLTTVGRRTGEERTAALWAYPDGESLVVVGSYGGNKRAPAWVHNLRANPTATIQVRREHRRVRAHEATGEEYDRLWKLVNVAYPGYAQYAVWAHRVIPLVVLERETAQNARPESTTAGEAVNGRASGGED